ncbi:MAG: homoserine kinase [Bacteroidota bacterium]
MNKIRLRGPATSANVGPGYDIFAMALRQPYDEMLLELTDNNSISIAFDGDDQNIPVTIQDNTAGLAILELKKRYKPDLGVKVTITKHMTSGCGLGTTGASASSAIYGLNKLLKLNLSDNELVDLARMGEIASGGSPHADNVAAAMLGGFILIKDYHPIDVLKLQMPEFPVVLAVIKKSQRSTRGFITYEIGQEKLKEQMAHCSRVIHAIHTKDVEEFGRAISVDNIAEPVRSAVIANYFETKTKVIAAGAFGSTVSGGGSSVITICPANLQDEIADIMESSLKVNPNFVKIIRTTTSNCGVCEM